MARQLVEHPEELATELATSIANFETYSNIDEHFHERGSDEEVGEAVAAVEMPALVHAEPTSRRDRTSHDLVFKLKGQKGLVPKDSDRSIDQLPSSAVMHVHANRLAFDYVDRELLVHRTKSPAKWDNETRNRGGLRLDVLLADAADHTPIVGEMKLPTDKDPFFGLIQALACAAHLATSHQYNRLRYAYDCQRKPKGCYDFPDSAPRLDVWVIFLGQGGKHNGVPSKGLDTESDKKFLGGAAEELALGLLGQSAMPRHIRRIAGIGMKVDEQDNVQSTVRWAWSRSGE